jgi:hypothetical protein
VTRPIGFAEDRREKGYRSRIPAVAQMVVRYSQCPNLPEYQVAGCVKATLPDQKIGSFETLASAVSRINTQVREQTVL